MIGLLAGTPRIGQPGLPWILVDMKSEIREFLTSRRGRITPDQAGLSSYGPRRVPGLRREEVAVLAGVSIQYYTRLERGGINGVSQSVLEALARALELDDAERAHLFDLARAAQPVGAPPRRHRIDPRAETFYDDWERVAGECVAIFSAPPRDATHTTATSQT